MMKQILLLVVITSFAWTTHAQAQPSPKKQRELTANARFPKPGEWPSFRRNGTLQAHSPLRGNIAKPAIIWKQFVGAMESLVVVEPSGQNTKVSLSGEKIEPGDLSDTISMADFIPVPKNEEEDNSSRQYTYADVLPEYPGKEKLEFESAFHKTMINGEWALCVGRCMARKNGEWIQIWETRPFAYLFEPLPLVGDFDNNNTQEIAILPFWQMLLIDAKTGIVRDSCRFNDNRSYGFAGVYDFDRDGKSEFLIQADFSKHVDVLGFKDGKLSLLWQHDIEQDVAHPEKILRVAPDPVMDIDNDGQPEVITTLFNDSGDGRWHLTFRDALTGTVKADFPDELLAARLDLDGDGVYEFLSTCSRGVSTLMKIRARSVKGSQLKIIWEKENAEWQSWDIQLPWHVKSLATGGQRTVLSRTDEKGTYVVIREPGSATRMNLSVARWDGSTFKPVTTVTGENLEGLGFDATGRILVRSRHRFGQQSSLDHRRRKIHAPNHTHYWVVHHQLQSLPGRMKQRYPPSWFREQLKNKLHSNLPRRKGQRFSLTTFLVGARAPGGRILSAPLSSILPAMGVVNSWWRMPVLQEQRASRPRTWTGEFSGNMSSRSLQAHRHHKIREELFYGKQGTLQTAFGRM